MKKHIVCFGDSNTYGYRADAVGERFMRYDESERYTTRLQALLGEEYLVIEEGLCGRTTVFEDALTEGLSGISYITPCLRSHSPVDLLIIMLGTNDVKERFGVSAQCIGEGMHRLLQKAIHSDCWADAPHILVVAPPHIGEGVKDTAVFGFMGEGCVEKSRELAYFYKERATALGCDFIDANVIQNAFTDIDHMHLTAKAHEELAEILSEYIQSQWV